MHACDNSYQVRIFVGDFAVMVTTGLTHGKSLFLLTIVMLPMYMGMILGATLSQLMDLTKVIFGISAAMFLFISLTELVRYYCYIIYIKK